MSFVQTSFHCLCSCKDRASERHRPNSRKKSPRPSPRRPRAVTMVQKALGMEHALSHTKEKVDMGMAKANQKAARASCRSFCLDVTTQTWICMEDACASTIRLGSALKLPMEENVQEGGICAAGRVVTPLTRRRSTTIRRSDNLTASGP